MNNKSAFVFTNYNNSDITAEAINSILNNIIDNEFNIEIIIVDNDSNLNEKNKLREISESTKFVKVIYLSENIGYFKGLNEGIKNLTNPSNFYDFVVIGNNDLYFENNFLKSVYENYNLFKNYPVVSPDIIRLDGFHQNPHVTKPISKFREIMYDAYYSNYYLSKIISFTANMTRKYTHRGDEKSYKIGGEIIEGYGACYLLGPLFFKSFEYLLAPTFLMGEESFLYYQLKEKNYNIYYEPNIKVKHHDHATVSNLPSKKFWKLSKDSHKIYKEFKKNKKNVNAF